MLQLQSCNPGIMSALSFRARFAGPYSKYDLPDVVMSGYLLNASEVNDNSTRFTFLFPLSYVDSIWQNETFDSMDIVCGGDASEDDADWLEPLGFTMPTPASLDKKLKGAAMRRSGRYSMTHSPSIDRT